MGAALIVDFSKYMREVVGFDKQRAEVTVQPGVVLDQLNAWLKPHGLWYPVDVSTSAQCTLGGMAGNNSCGSRSIRYGNMVHNVAAIDAILADGRRARFDSKRPEDMQPAVRAIADKVAALAIAEQDEIARMYPKVLRRVGGYNLDIFFPQSERPYTTDNSVNLAHLLVGSEGTLAVTERLTLKLSRLPKHKTLGVVNFPSFYKAMDSAQHIVKLKPTAVELVDRTMIELARANPAFRPVIERALIGKPEAILLVEFSGEEHEAQLRDLARLVELMADLGMPGSVVEMPEPGPQSALWEVRKAGLNIMMSMKGDGKPVSFIEDCAVPLEHLADYTQRLTDVFAKHGTRGTWYAHASVGTLHVRPILDMRREGATKMRAIAEEASAIVREYKGAYSGEHGDGLVRSEWVAWQFGPRITKAFGAIKEMFDPDDRLNPGKIVRPTKMDDRALFRFKPGYEAIDYKPALDWSAWNVQNDPTTETLTEPGSGGDPSGGFAKAVEMCNNNGHCRKFDAGTMCPSFRVTRDEVHLTRGRANTLRLALSGQLGKAALTSDTVAKALDLCVSCKGCKRDCPTGVDMARMKIEAKSARRMSKGLRLRDRLIGDLPAMAPWARRLPWLFNLAALVQPWLGFAKQRALPKWRSDTFLATTDVDAKDATVVIFADTFSNNFEPEILHAARRVLEAAGHRVAVAWPTLGARSLCCGRTYLATGQVDKARAEAAAAARGAVALRGPRRAGGRARAVVPVHLARRVPGAGSWRAGAQDRRQRLPVRGIPGAREEGGSPHAQSQAATSQDSAAAWPLPPEGVRRHERGSRSASASAGPCRHSRSSRAAAAWPAASATRPSTTTPRSPWPSFRCCRRCARPLPTRWSWPTAPRAATRSPTASADRRYTSHKCWNARSLEATLRHATTS